MKKWKLDKNRIADSYQVTLQDAIKQVEHEIKVAGNSYAESDGMVRDTDLIIEIRSLQLALRLLKAMRSEKRKK